MRILIVDDQVLFHEGLARLLDSQPGFCVVGGAQNVRDAIEKARVLQPDVILMDFSLPDGTGLDATGVILQERPSTHIVFLTVHEEDDRLFEAVRYGARGYLLKNIPIQELVAYLHGLERGEPAIQPKFTAYILQEFSRTPARQEAQPEQVARLTIRQRQILRELRHGASNSQIADCLVISEQTVKNHISRLLNQLNLHNRHEAAEFARRYNI